MSNELCQTKLCGFMSVQIWNCGQIFVVGTTKIFLAKSLELWGGFRMDFLSVELF